MISKIFIVWLSFFELGPKIPKKWKHHKIDSKNWGLHYVIHGCFLKWWYPTTMGFPTKNDDFGVEIGGTTILGNPHILEKAGSPKNLGGRPHIRSTRRWKQDPQVFGVISTDPL